MQRRRSELQLQAPPPSPSPIPTGKGSRSAANETLVHYLHNSLHVPKLTRPRTQLEPDRLYQNNIIPAEVEFGSLISGERNSVDGVIRSARDLGVFLLTGHGISEEDLRSLVQELLTDGNTREEKEEITWLVQSCKEGLQLQLMELEQPAASNRDFSDKMEKIACKLDAIAQQLGKVLVENSACIKPSEKRTKREHSVLRLIRYNHNYKAVASSSSKEKSQNSSGYDHIFCLHFSTSPSQLHVQTARGPFSFDSCPDTILVAFGKRVQELSTENIRSVSGEVMCEPHLQGSEVSFSVEFKCLSFNFDNYSSTRSRSTISIRDQILIALVIAFSYKILLFLCS